MTHGQLYTEEKTYALEDSLKKALLKYGLVEQIYCDYAEEKTMPKKAGDPFYTCISG